jgi:hypothetical protein
MNYSAIVVIQAAEEIRSLREKLRESEAYVVLTKTLHNKAVDERDEAYRQRDEARAACVFMRPRIVEYHRDKQGEGFFCIVCGNHEAPWGKDGDGFGFPTKDGTEKHGKGCPMSGNPGQPLLDRLHAAEQALAEAPVQPVEWRGERPDIVAFFDRYRRWRGEALAAVRAQKALDKAP